MIRSGRSQRRSAVGASFAVLCWAMLAIAGCGSGVGGAGSPAQRTARTTCRDQGVPDDLIDFDFTLVRNARNDGYSASQVIQGVRQGCAVGDEFGGGCSNNPNVGVTLTLQQCIQQCSICAIAVIDEVYGIQ